MDAELIRVAVIFFMIGAVGGILYTIAPVAIKRAKKMFNKKGKG